jgi:hypothetical protein
MQLDKCIEYLSFLAVVMYQRHSSSLESQSPYNHRHIQHPPRSNIYIPLFPVHLQLRLSI